MKLVTTSMLISLGLASSAFAQSKFEASLCEAAKTGRVVELVYDKDASKGCAPRIIDVHQVAIGNNGSFYMHGWQSRGCTKGRDFEAKRIFKLEKVKAVELVVGDFGEKSQSAKDEGWNGCIGSNCFIKENICE
ncbi:hypothetical protein [Planktotalea sp.]|uniref:hypothetical protein n=1 Tax=Planktotalea sp. TaxID=2029877 RepID=UPI0025D0593F|nr:hypothetical protein [Planktotalea sp.]